MNLINEFNEFNYLINYLINKFNEFDEFITSMNLIR